MAEVGESKVQNKECGASCPTSSYSLATSAVPPRSFQVIEITYPIIEIADLEATEAGRKTALLCQSADALKALDIVVLDVRGQTILADYFILCSGTSTTHIQSIAENARDEMREHGYRSKPEGVPASLWVVLDYGDAILHVLNEETREFYDLERLWAEAKIAGWPDSATSDTIESENV